MTAIRRDGKHQSPMLQWVRENERLDSKKYKLSLTDVDLCVHRFAPPESIYLLECKTFDAALRFAQKDTLSVLNQIFRKSSISQGRRYAITIPDTRYPGRQRSIRNFGVHVLRMSGDSPLNSERMLWDEKPVTTEQLEQLLRFEADPDNPATLLSDYKTAEAA